MDKSYLLNSPLATRLYEECAKSLPIIDYHNHLSMKDISSDGKFENITKLWISSDPYKHRAMRILGVPEKCITGDATDYEKFEAWYNSLPKLIGNVLFDWSEMELATVFDFPLLPFNKSAEEVWCALNEKLSEMSTKDILKKFNIKYSAPCTALCDDLAVFEGAAPFAPSLRGDDLLLPTGEVITKLSSLTKKSISTVVDYLSAIDRRLEDFAKVGCRYTDHALDAGFDYATDDGKNEERFKSLISGENMSECDKAHLSSYILKSIANLYARRGLIMQLHIGAQRKTSTRLREVAGAAGGYAAIGSTFDIGKLIRLLDEVEMGKHGIPKTILFTLNPKDNAAIANLSGSFSKDGVEAIISQGPAWWWCDHYQGMKDMLSHLAAYGVLSTFIGMTTDSRSLLSFVRHDYFRRVLCRTLGEWADGGLIPNDFGLLSDIVKNICYENANKTLQ